LSRTFAEPLVAPVIPGRPERDGDTRLGGTDLSRCEVGVCGV
jgi:hypothetical protein